MRNFWLIFSQTTAIALGVLFVVATLRPDLLPWTLRGTVVTVQEAAPAAAAKAAPSYSEAALKAMPSVVNIFTTKEIKVPKALSEEQLFRFFFGDPEPQKSFSLGSGVIVSPEGYILTNHHVIEAADEIEVALADGRKARASAAGTDPETDLAVIKIELKDLPAVTFGRADQVKVGDVVLAIGNPFGVGQTVTMGIVSALGRSHLGINTFENFIQTDAAINRGNSGGALVDVAGNLIGINTAIYSETGGSIGIGFAIPVNLAKQVMDQIIQTGGVTRGWIGVEVQDLTPELAESFRFPGANGALIAGVLRGSPADLAGIRRGDVLLSVEGKPVTDATSMLNLIAALEPGKSAKFKMLRNQTEILLTVNVGKRPKPRPRPGE